MIVKESRNDLRKKRHARVRNKVSGTAECPRLNVFRSNTQIFAQIKEKFYLSKPIFNQYSKL